MSYVPLAQVTLTGSDLDIVFGSIPNTFRDLVLIYTGTQTNSSGELYVRFNGDTGSNYSTVQMGGTGSGSPFSAQYTNSRIVPTANVGESSSVITNMVLQIMDYSTTDRHKTCLLRSNNAALGTQMQANRWANTNAINAVRVEAGFAGQLAAGTTIALYGIAG